MPQCPPSLPGQGSEPRPQQAPTPRWWLRRPGSSGCPLRVVEEDSRSGGWLSLVLTTGHGWGGRWRVAHVADSAWPGRQAPAAIGASPGPDAPRPKGPHWNRGGSSGLWGRRPTFPGEAEPASGLRPAPSRWGHPLQRTPQPSGCVWVLLHMSPCRARFRPFSNRCLLVRTFVSFPRGWRPHEWVGSRGAAQLETRTAPTISGCHPPGSQHLEPRPHACHARTHRHAHTDTLSQARRPRPRPRPGPCGRPLRRSPPRKLPGPVSGGGGFGQI